MIKQAIETETGDRLNKIESRWYRGPGPNSDASRVREVTPKTRLAFSRLANPDYVHSGKIRKHDRVSEMAHIGNKADYIMHENGLDIDEEDDDDDDEGDGGDAREQEEQEEEDAVMKAALRLLESSKREKPPPPPKSPQMTAASHQSREKKGVHTPVRPKSLGNLLNVAPELSAILQHDEEQERHGGHEEEEDDDDDDYTRDDDDEEDGNSEEEAEEAEEGEEEEGEEEEDAVNDDEEEEERHQGESLHRIEKGGEGGRREHQANLPLLVEKDDHKRKEQRSEGSRSPDTRVPVAPFGLSRKPPAAKSRTERDEEQGGGGGGLGRILSQNSKSKSILRNQLMRDAHQSEDSQQEDDDSDGEQVELVRSFKHGRPRTRHDHGDHEELILLQNMPKQRRNERTRPTPSSGPSPIASSSSSSSPSYSTRRPLHEQRKHHQHHHRSIVKQTNHSRAADAHANADADDDDDDIKELLSARVHRMKKRRSGRGDGASPVASTSSSSSSPSSSVTSSSHHRSSRQKHASSSSPDNTVLSFSAAAAMEERKNAERRAERKTIQKERRETIRRARKERRQKEDQVSSTLMPGTQPWQQLMDSNVSKRGDDDSEEDINVDSYSTDDLFKEEGDVLPEPVSDTDSDNDTPELHRERRKRRKHRKQIKLKRIKRNMRSKRLHQRKEEERLWVIQHRHILDELRASNPQIPEYADDEKLDTLKYAVQKYSGQRAMQDKVSQFKAGLSFAAEVIEFVAAQTKGFVQLKGFAARLRAHMDLPKNQNTLAQLSRKYMTFGSIPPEIMLGTMFLITARQVHISNSGNTPLPPVAEERTNQLHEPQPEEGEMSGIGSVFGSAMKFMQGGDDAEGGGGIIGSVLSAFTGGGGGRSQKPPPSSSTRLLANSEEQQQKSSSTTNSAPTSTGGGGGHGSDPSSSSSSGGRGGGGGMTASEKIVASILDDDDEE